jgi:hypothetical protein
MGEDFDYLRLVYLIGVFILVAPGIAFVLRDKSKLLQYTVMWLAIIAAIAIFYRMFGWPA